MSLLSKWRKNHPKKIDPFTAEERRLHEYIATLELGTDQYKEAQQLLRTVCDNREKSRESRKNLDKAGRASVWTKIIGGIGTLAGIGALGYYEMKGNTFSGEKRKLADGLSNLVTNLIKNH